jgi:hypothetical protein
MEAIGEEDDVQLDASVVAGAKVMARVDEVVVCKDCGSALESTLSGGYRYFVDEKTKKLRARCLCNSEFMGNVEVECRAELPVTSNCVYRARKVAPGASSRLASRELVADPTLMCVEIACASPGGECQGTKAVQCADGFRLEFTCTQCFYTWKMQ